MPLTPKQIFKKKKTREKITVLTAYDFPFSKALDETGVDIVLVGDSLGMVVLGHETTLPVTMENMIHHTLAVSRGVKRAMIIADMPYRSYSNPRLALKNAKALLKAGAQAVKLEGSAEVQAQVKALIQAGIAVMGHVGMTPQSVEKLGGYKVQGRDPKQAQKILEDAKRLADLGVFAIVLECVPAALGKKITEAVACPTIGIGAGPDTDGQVLVLHDMLGFESKVHPRFVRRYATLGEETKTAVEEYIHDVKTGRFPSKEESY